MEHFTGPSLHRPLNKADPTEIRIVKLHQGLWDDPITCELENYSLGSKIELRERGQELIALSYVWGDPEVTEPISVNGVQYPVTINLAQVLRRVRQRFNRQCTLWVDALCINQSDVQERAVEIRRMGQIYASATILIGYIGEPGQDEKPGISRLFEVSQSLRREFSDLGAKEDLENADILELTRRRDWMGTPDDQVLLNLSTRAFFSRIWIVQELALAYFEAYLICGGLIVPLQDLVLMYQSLGVYIEDRHRTATRQLTYVRQAQGLLAPCSIAMDLRTTSSFDEDDPSKFAKTLMKYLRRTCEHQSTDPRDKIFALLGLMKAKLPGSLFISYEQPTSTVYHAFTKFLLEHAADLTIFESTSIQGVVPSWTMDLVFTNPSIPNFEPSDPPDVEISDDGMTMSVHGTRFGQVAGILEVKEFLDVSLPQNIPALLQLVQDIMRFAAKSLGIRPIEYVYNIPEGLRNMYRWATTELREILDMRRRFRENPADEDETMAADCYNWFSVLSLYSWIRLDSGMIYKFRNTPGPCRVKEGDIVCLWKGCRRLSIVRQSEKEDHFNYVHSCFIYERRSTRALTEDDWSRVELENFLII